jgi:hypothetical protein
MPVQTLAASLDKPMKLNALIVKSFGHFVASATATLQLYEHCYPRVPLVFPISNLLLIKDIEQIPKATSLRAAGSRNTPLLARGPFGSIRQAKQYSQH